MGREEFRPAFWALAFLLAPIALAVVLMIAIDPDVRDPEVPISDGIAVFGANLVWFGGAGTLYYNRAPILNTLEASWQIIWHGLQASLASLPPAGQIAPFLIVLGFAVWGVGVLLYHLVTAPEGGESDGD